MSARIKEMFDALLHRIELQIHMACAEYHFERKAATSAFRRRLGQLFKDIEK